MPWYWINYPCFEVLVEIFDLINWIEEDKYLRFFIHFLIEMLKDCSNHILMHLGLISQHFVVILYSLKGNLCSSSKLALNHIVNIEFKGILYMLLVET